MKNENGFIPMIVMLLIALLVIIVVVYLRVQKAQSGY